MTYRCKMFGKTGVLVVVIMALSACASSPPKAPEPTGAVTPVNPTNINFSDLKIK